MEIKVDEQFARKAFIAACNNWRVTIIKEIPNLHKGWFITPSGCSFVYCGDKNFAVDEINGKWRIAKQRDANESALTVKTHPHNWKKVGSHSSDWQQMIIDLMAEFGKPMDARRHILTFNEHDIVLNESQTIFDKGEWLLEKTKDYFISGTDLRGTTIYEVLESSNPSPIYEDDPYFVSGIVYRQHHLNKDTLEDIRKAFKNSRAFFNEYDAEQAVKKLNWTPGKLYWVKDKDEQNWMPRIAAKDYGRFEGATEGIYIGRNQWKRANRTPDKPSE